MYSPPLGTNYPNLFPDWNDGTFVDPRMLETAPTLPRELGEWKRSTSARLQPRDKAYIRFLYTHGVDEEEILEESNWGLNTVRKAIKNDYGKASLKISEAEVERQFARNFMRGCARYRPVPRAKQAPVARELSASHSSQTQHNTRFATARFRCHTQFCHTHPEQPILSIPHHPRDADDIFLRAFLARASLEQQWLTEFCKKELLRGLCAMWPKCPTSAPTRISPGSRPPCRLRTVSS
ncbi:hypothetical protein B0H17DRAFT_1216298 [Mycena rosella]|uniref:Uncharacterized protein n=1 Tax=Mycena rosella TaxID=1033263 RepID=A0AAD7FXL3_MYCRO|nr:hypothetical protein B0H17DRAFT_1216298 [Mycena rosella]